MCVCVCGLEYKFGVLLSMLDKMVVLWFVIDCIDHILFFRFLLWYLLKAEISSYRV